MTTFLVCPSCTQGIERVVELDDGTGRVLCPKCLRVIPNYVVLAPPPAGAKRSTISKLEAQLAAAHEAINELRRELSDYSGANMKLHAAIVDVLRFHDDCVCRHTRRILRGALNIRTDRMGRPLP